MIIQIPSNLVVYPTQAPTKTNPLIKVNSNFNLSKQPTSTTLHFPLSKLNSSIPSNMWWADIKAAIGQRFNLEGILSTAKVITRDHNLSIPHLTVPDIRYINWSELRKIGFNGVIFDKDNTLTAPYTLTIWAPLKPSLDRCKAAFGEDNVAVFSNSAGLLEYDQDGSKARELEREIGVRVIRHKVKKPAGNSEEIEKHFGCSSDSLVMVGDRSFTDIVYGNRNGFLTVLTQPFSLQEENVVVKNVRKLESFFVGWWCKKGFKPVDHRLVTDGCLDLVYEKPPSEH